MVEERAVITGLDNTRSGYVIAQTQRKSACDSCSLKSGCGTSTLSKISGNKSFSMSVENTLRARVGDVVILSIPEEGLLKASAVMFVVPLLLMFVGAFVGQYLFSGQELAIILFGLMGLFGGFAYARYFGSAHNQSDIFLPKMTALALEHDPNAVCSSAVD